MNFDNHATAVIDEYIYYFCDVLSIVNMRSKLREDYKLIWNLDSHR